MKTFSVNTDDGPTKEIMWVQFAIDNGTGNYTWKVADTFKKNPATPDPVYAGPTTKEELQQKVWDSTALKNIVAPGVVNTITDASYLFTNAATPTQWYKGSDMPDWEFTSATTCANFNRGNTSTVHGVLNAPNCTSASYAFYGNTKLESVKLNVGTQPITFNYAFHGCTSLTSLDGLPVDEEGYQIIKCSSRPNLIFRSCSNLAGKYKLDITDSGASSSDMFKTNAGLPTTGDLDLKIVYSKTITDSSGSFCLNHPNIHDVYIEGGTTTLGTSNSSGTASGAFDGCKNLNKVHFVYRGTSVASTSTVFWRGYLLRNTSCREFIGDWTRASIATTAGLLMENCFSGATKLRRLKLTCKLNGQEVKGMVVGTGNGMCSGDTNLTQAHPIFRRYQTSNCLNAFKGCKLDLPSVQFIAENAQEATQALTLGISRYKLAYDTSKNAYFEAGEVKYTDDDKIWYLNHDGTETTEPNDDNNLNDYITTDPAQGSYGNGGYYAKGELAKALDDLVAKGYVLTVEYN